MTLPHPARASGAVLLYPLHPATALLKTQLMPLWTVLLTVLFTALFTAGLACWPSPPLQAAEFGDPGARMRVVWREGLVVVGVYPKPNEGYIQIARRVMAKPGAYPKIVAFNAKRPVRSGVAVNFPITTLKPVLWGRALRALHPEDELTDRGWTHNVSDPGETLIQLTEAYTGDMGRFKALARYNKLRNPNVLRLGREIAIPLPWIPDALGFRPLAVKAPLRLQRDQKSGRLYAAYRVHRNDTLFSLLLRFTDRERADELERMTRALVKINRLTGVTRLLVDRDLRIPVEWLNEDYLVSPGQPGKSPQAQAARPAAPPAASAKKPPAQGRKPPPKQAKRPDPKRVPKSAKRIPDQKSPLDAEEASKRFHVILDAGHGGNDPGAAYGTPGKPDRVYEHEVVHDISLRLSRLLRGRGIRVYPTVEDPASSNPMERLTIRGIGREQVRVTPPYRMRSSKVAINMRIFLINSIYRRLTRKLGVDPGQVLLVSLHGDALAPSLRGAMVYYPDSRLRVGEFNPRGQVYRVRSEAVPGKLFFRRDDNRASEELSRDVAERIIGTFAQHKLGAAHRRPVRSYYYRKGVRTLPGVLRYSQVPSSVLVEVGNLNNTAERRSIMQGATRQRIARALGDALDRLRADRLNQRNLESRPRTVVRVGS